MQVFIDIQIFRGKEIQFFDNIIWQENIDNSFYVEEGSDGRILIPLKNAPEKVLTNLYLFKIPSINIDDNIDERRFENVTPIDLLKAIALPSPSYMYGFLYGHKIVRGKNFRGKVLDKNKWIPLQYGYALNPTKLKMRPLDMRNLE